MNITKLKRALEEGEKQARGRYQKAIYEYAFELVDNIADQYTTTAEELEHIENIKDLKELALNGATDWYQYSWGGCSLCYNYDILTRLFCPQIYGHFCKLQSFLDKKCLCRNKFATNCLVSCILGCRVRLVASLWGVNFFYVARFFLIRGNH